MKKYIRIWVLRNLMQFQAEIVYRVEVIFLFLNTVVLIAATLILYTLIFSQTKAVGDWNYLSMIYLYAIGNTAISLFTMFAWGPIYHQFRPAVKSGSMDMFLLKPMSAVYLLLTGRFDLSGLARLIPSVALLIFLVIKFPLTISPWVLVAAFLCFIVGLTLLTATIFILYSLSFWTTSTDYFHHPAWAFISATSMPLSAFPTTVFWAFSTIVPVAFAGVIPVRLLTQLNQITPILISQIALTLVVFLLVSTRIWQMGLRNYSGASA